MSTTPDCQICQKPFQPQRMGQVVCGYSCAKKVPAAARKVAAKAIRARKEAVKTRSQWLKEAQASFNAWIRVRDAALPCISCGRQHDGQWHASHFLSTGARPELRFDPANVHKGCQPCNTHLHGNLVLYRAELIRRIGQAEVDRLEGPHPTRKWTIDELKLIKANYRARVKEIELSV